MTATRGCLALRSSTDLGLAGGPRGFEGARPALEPIQGTDYDAAMRIGLFLVATIGCKHPEAPDCVHDTATACFSGVFRDLLGAELEGVEICAPELPEIPCTSSDGDGGWQMAGLPLDSDVLITASYEDAVPTVFAQHTSMDWYDWYKVMVPQSVMSLHASRMDTELDDSKGNLLFLVWEGLNIDGIDTPNVPDVVAEIAPPATVFYASGLGLASSDLTATSGAGSGGALNLEPGDHQVGFTAPGGSCDEHSFSYAFEPGSPIPFPILQGFTTAIDVICPPLP